MLAEELGIKFVPIRKPGKLGGPVAQASYTKEYGKDIVEMQELEHLRGARVVCVDDLMATGGTMKAAVDVCKRVGAHPVASICLIELMELNGQQKLGAVPTLSVLQLWPSSDTTAAGAPTGYRLRGETSQ
jgi:adenine phosphoribosyltransferase